jgi:O-antigen ligase
MHVLALIAGASALRLAWIGVPMVKKLVPQLCWWHVLWAALFLSDFTFRARTTEAALENPLDPWGMYRVALVGVVAVTLLLRLAFKATSTLAVLSSGPVGWLMVYGLVNLVSATWSVYPVWTLYKSLEFLTDLALLAAIVATVRSLREYRTLFDWTWVLYGSLVLVVWGEVLLWPAEAIEHNRGLLGIAISGVVPAVASNAVGRLGAILGIVATIRLLRPTAHRGFYAMTLLLSLASLVFAQSRGALAGFLAALLVTLIAMRRRAIFMAVLLTLVVALFNPTLRDVAWRYVLRGQEPELFHSLSGRTDWWEIAWQRFHDSPLVGYGGYAGPRFAVLATISGESTTSTLHNAWLDVLLGTGVLGFVLLIAAVLAVCTILWRVRSHALHETEPGRLWLEAAGLLTVLLVTSMVTTELIWHPPLFLLLIVGYTQHLRRRSPVVTVPSFPQILPEST